MLLVRRMINCLKMGTRDDPKDVLEDEAYSHVDPWVEIWDRGRVETDIDANGDRAHGAVKVVKVK